MALYKVEFTVRVLDDSEEAETLQELKEELKATLTNLRPYVELKNAIEFTRSQVISRRGSVRRVDA